MTARTRIHVLSVVVIILGALSAGLDSAGAVEPPCADGMCGACCSEIDGDCLDACEGMGCPNHWCNIFENPLCCSEGYGIECAHVE
jgi:hypothetical protein